MIDDFYWAGFNKNNSAHQAIKDFLILDVQIDPIRSDNMISTIKKIQNGSLPNWNGGGNAYFCDIDINGAQLEVLLDDFDDDDIPLIPLTELIDALSAWSAYCRKYMASSPK